MISFDRFYNVQEYLEILQALEYNDVDYSEYIDASTKMWYVDIESTPTHKYSVCRFKRYLVQKTKVLRTTEEHLYERSTGVDVSRYITNDCLEQLLESDLESCYAFLATSDEAYKLSDVMPCKIWWFGRYYQNLGVCVCTQQPDIEDYVDVPIEYWNFDLAINKYLLKHKTYLRKYTEQPYFFDGKFYGFRGLKPHDY